MFVVPLQHFFTLVPIITSGLEEPRDSNAKNDNGDNDEAENDSYLSQQRTFVKGLMILLGTIPISSLLR